MLLSSLNKNMEYLHFCVIGPLSRFIGFGVGKSSAQEQAPSLRMELSFYSNGLCFRNCIFFFNLEFSVASCPSKFSHIALFIYLEVAKPCCKFVERCLEDILFRVFSIRNSWVLNIQEQLLYCTRGSVY